jgi:hypothetical protein
MQLKRPPSPERLEQARQLLADGASQREVQRTTGIARETLRKHFPGQGWTFVQGGEFTFRNFLTDQQIARKYNTGKE